jgi:hypothetical protein
MRQTYTADWIVAGDVGFAGILSIILSAVKFSFTLRIQDGEL